MRTYCIRRTSTNPGKKSKYEKLGFGVCESGCKVEDEEDEI